MRALRHRDFRILWLGALISFTGTWIQSVAQGWLVFELTHDKARVATVFFAGMAPGAIFGPFAGAFADRFDKRWVLVVCQSTFAIGAIFLTVATYMNFVQYWHILMVALVNGVFGCIETPTRQSVISRVVPPEDLAAAVPVNAMTFNLARIIWPSIGGVLAATFGPKACYLTNACSYTALILSIILIKSNLKPENTRKEPIKDLLFEGMQYTFRDKRLRTLFIMEAIVASFGLFYISQMPAIAKEMLGLKEQGLGLAMTCVGIGAMSGLLLVTRMADLPIKGRIVGIAMFTFGIGLTLLGFSRTPFVAFPILVVVGMASIAQFNTTNALFQVLSPDRLRGRVIAMHVWALSGLLPAIGILALGRFAQDASLPLALNLGGVLVLAGAIWGFFNRDKLKDAA